MKQEESGILIVVVQGVEGRRNSGEYKTFKEINRVIRYHKSPKLAGKGSGKLNGIQGKKLTYQFTDKVKINV